MKTDTRAARKYAGALFNVALQQNTLDRAGADLSEVATLTAGNPELLVLMRQPRIQSERKKELVRRLFAGLGNDLVFDFLQLLVDRQRFALVEAIHQEFGRLLEEHQRVLPAVATTAVPMAADQQERLRQRLSEITGYRVLLETRVDAELLGGLRIRMKGQLIDGSVATQLRRLRELFKQTRITR